VESEKCPKCGAHAIGPADFTCGSRRGRRFIQTIACGNEVERQRDLFAAALAVDLGDWLSWDFEQSVYYVMEGPKVRLVADWLAFHALAYAIADWQAAGESEGVEDY